MGRGYHRGAKTSSSSPQNQTLLHVRQKIFKTFRNGKKAGLHSGFEIDQNLGNRKQTDTYDNEVKAI